jgi:transitional endoplasmic reticulum ATPase
VVIGATNRPDIIDEALLRPGRFDRVLQVPIPDREARKQIFHSHTERKPLDSDVNLDKLVEMTDRMTGADIAAIVNAAAMTAIKEHVSKKAGKLKISMRHFEAALNKVKRGGSKGNTRDLQSLPASGSLTQIPDPSHA